MVSAEIYKWVDEDGKVHFDDRPAGHKKEKIEMNVKTTPSPTDTELNDRLEEERQERNLTKAREKKKRKKEIKAACADAKDYKKSSDDVRVYNLDENGERVFLSDEERDAEDKELHDFIKNNCK